MSSSLYDVEHAAKLRRTEQNKVATMHEAPCVSVIVAVHNCLPFLDECFESLLEQDGLAEGQLQVSVVDDCSSDGSAQHCEEVWGPRMRAHGIGWVFSSTKSAAALSNSAAASEKIGQNRSPISEAGTISNELISTSYNSADEVAVAKPRGAAFARNQAVRQSSGEYLCIQDADDVSRPERIRTQMECALKHPNAIIGSQFERSPAGSTERYTRWCNTLTPERVMLEQYRELTVIQPTWFLRKDLFDKLGAYRETEDDGSRALAEDLDFFHRHLDSQPRLQPPKQIASNDSDIDGSCCVAKQADHKHDLVSELQSQLLVVVPEVLLMYRYRLESVSGQTSQRLLLKIRTRALERRVLSQWETFEIWGAGKDGKKFYMTLKDEFKKKVTGFVDIDPKKIERNYYCMAFKRTLPVRHVTEVTAPFICCVALDRTNGAFEKNVRATGCVEGQDYFHLI